jgi:Ca2+-binding EF-hand superfamily protein
MRILIAAATAAAMATFAVPANAEPTTLEIVFVKADENGDLTLSKGEILMMAIRQFELTDANGDEILQAEEVGELATEAEFLDNDADKGGSISIEEMIEEKLADFKQIDADGDGLLTMDELEKTYGAE